MKIAICAGHGEQATIGLNRSLPKRWKNATGNITSDVSIMHAGIIKGINGMYKTVIGLTVVGQGSFDQCSDLAMELNEDPDKARALIKVFGGYAA